MGQIFHGVKTAEPFIWTIYCFHKQLNHGVNQPLSADKGNRSYLLGHLLVIHNLPLVLSRCWTGPYILPTPKRVTMGKSIMFEMYFEICVLILHFTEGRTCLFFYPADPQSKETVMKVTIPAGTSAIGYLELAFISFPIKSTSFFKCFDIYWWKE